MVLDTITYNSVISTCEKSNEASWALEVCRAMQRREVVPDIITYSALISACEKGRQPE